MSADLASGTTTSFSARYIGGSFISSLAVVCIVKLNNINYFIKPCKQSLTNTPWFYCVGSTEPSIVQASFGGAGGFFAGVVGILVNINSLNTICRPVFDDIQSICTIVFLCIDMVVFSRLFF